MNKEEAINIAKRYINKVNDKYIITSALLFGSCIKGTSNENSDIDIALVIEDIPDIFEAQFELMKLRRGIDLRIEPHPFRLKDFNNQDPIVNEIMKIGYKLNISN